jgi:predicted RNA-binding protein Jag
LLAGLCYFRIEVPLLFLAVFATAASAQAPQSVAPEKIIGEYLRAMGGAKAVAQIQTETIAGSLTEQDTGKTGSYSRIAKAPNQFYSEMAIEHARDVEAYNGMSAWGQNAEEGARTLTGAAAKEAEAAARYSNSRLVDLKKFKLSAQFAGMESVRGRDAYRVRVLLGQGMERDVFFDAQTHRIVRETAGSEQFDYDDYRPVNGIPTPFRIEIRRGGRAYSISVTHAEINAPVDDSIFDFPRVSGAPLPDVKALFLEVVKNQKAIEEMQKQYTCHVTEEEEEMDSKAQVKSRKIKESEVFNIAGDEVRRLIAKDGKPLSVEEQNKEDERFNKEFDKATKKEAELARDPNKRERQEAKDEQQLSDLLRAIRFSNPRRERFRGQEVIAVDFGPNPEYKPKKMMEKIAQNVAGVIWIDERAHDVARLEAHFNDSAKIGGGIVAAIDKGSNFVFEQAKVNGEVWLPVYDEVHFGGRLLFVKTKANQIDRYSDYKKFHAESKIVPVGDQ